MQDVRLLIYTVYVILYVMHIFAGGEGLRYVMGCAGMFALVLSFTGANRTYQVLSLVFFSVSVCLFVINDLPLQELPAYFTSMALLLSLLYMIPFIQHFMIVGRYERALYRLLQSNTRHLGQFYRRTSFTHYVLGLFIFLSAIPVVYRFVQKRLHGFSEDIFHRFATQSMLRSIASVNVWSPIEVYIALVLSITSVSYLTVLPWLLSFSLFMLMLDWLSTAVKYRKYSFDTTSKQGDVITRTEIKKLGQMALFLILFISTAALFSLLFAIDFFEAIIVIILPYTLIWAAFIKRSKTFWRYNILTWPQQMKTMQNFMLLFLTLGFFNEVVHEADLFTVFRQIFSTLGTQPILLFFLLQVSALGLAFAGIHPLVTISLQGLLVEPLLGQVNPVSISIVMITATLANDAAGTFNVPITMMSQYTKRNPYQLTVWNLPFAFMFGVIGVFLAYLLL
ncbi:hypothetical protein SAMN05192534_112102 [Alteribacillus persepolensis]|uniref:Uncharacterized protein n=1 Tax=Alteribacillus persepolensis TaxID=568899 RepID=A0A1G8FML5_9BACI|nr:hypothetical protein [Alteribacillus persepolensis]SDH83400.1 hypothetical protein SAMN05192534_112102 [Alteribacillus persepolensis]